MRITHITRTAPFCLTLLSASIANAENSALSLQGYSGLFNIPNAHVTNYGTGIVQYADQMFLNNEYTHNDNLFGSFGVLPNVEIGGRIAWFHTHSNLFKAGNNEPRDLSANIKIKIPFIPDDWFSIAVGEQDIGGEANYFDAKYIVASKTFGPLRIDAGVGKNDSTNRLDGAFGGFELQPVDWLSLIAEYDASDINAGFRLSTPKRWLPQGARADLTVMAYNDNPNSDDRSFYGLAFQFPLGGGFVGKRPNPIKHNTLSSLNNIQKSAISRKTPPFANQLLAKSTSYKTYKQHQQTTLTDTTTNHLTTTESLTAAQQKSLQLTWQLLKAQKFERIRLGVQASDTVIVAFENTVYNHNELDALGVVLGLIAQENEAHFEQARVILKNQGLAVLEVKTDLHSYKQFLNTDNPTPINLEARLVSANTLKNVQWAMQTSTAEAHKPRLTLSPAISSAIATELGVWDYSVSLESNLAVSLWKGALVSATYNHELAQSDDFEKGKTFYDDRQQDGLKNVSFQQTFNYRSLFNTPLFNTTHIGKIRYDYTGIQNQSTFISPDGDHKLGLRLGYYEHEDNSNDERNVHLASYRYYLDDYDVSVEITGGQFWAEDTGYRVESFFWFGDNAVSLFYKDTDAEFIGIRWTLPLTPRKDFNSQWGQVKGKSNWNYNIQTRINEDANMISFGVADIPKWRHETEITYLNNDRLNPAYIYSHLRRLKEAYLLFK